MYWCVYVFSGYAIFGAWMIMYILLYLDCVCVKVYTLIYTLGHCGANAFRQFDSLLLRMVGVFMYLVGMRYLVLG